MNVNVDETWKKILADEFSKPYFLNLTSFIKKDILKHTIYPKNSEIFNAFAHCKFTDMRVVIIGQDPYHGIGQANGLCFSVKDGIKTPPSLVNIFKEIKSDLAVDIPVSGNLERWAKQGILLLNTVLTVRESSPGSHQGKGWEIFTNAIIRHIANKKNI